jgi:hypothetical protein
MSDESKTLTARDVFEARKRNARKHGLMRHEGWWEDWEDLTPEQIARLEKDATKINKIIDEEW